MTTLNIYKEYFNGLITLTKPFELRKRPFKSGDRIKVLEIDKISKQPTGRYLIIKVAQSFKLEKDFNLQAWRNPDCPWLIREEGVYDKDFDHFYDEMLTWYDKNVWAYINDNRPNYLIQIASIEPMKEVK